MNVLKSSAIYSFFTFLSRIFGFLRDILIANFLGAGFLADIFFVAFRFPNTFRRIFSEGALNSAFVPIYSKLVVGTETNESGKFAGNIISILTLSTLLIVILVEIFMPSFLHYISISCINKYFFNMFFYIKCKWKICTFSSIANNLKYHFVFITNFILLFFK